MSEPRMIFVIVGGPAAGKSTTARALAARFPRAVHIPVDTLRDLVVQGHALPQMDWSPDLIEQVRLARGVAISAAEAYAQAGFRVVIDDFCDPPGLREYAVLDGRGDVHRTVLAPSVEETFRRSRLRSGPDTPDTYIESIIPYANEVLAGHLPDLVAAGWQVLDSTAMTVDQTVDAILGAAR